VFEKLKHTFKQTAIYSLGNISTKLIGLILLPLYTNPEHLSISDYGVWTILEITSQIMIGVLALNLPIAMLRWSSAEKNNEKTKSIIFTTILSLIVIIVISLLFLIPNTEYFSFFLFDSTQYSAHMFLLFIVVSFGIYNGVPLNIIRIKENSSFYVVATSLKFLIILLLNIYFVVYQHDGILGILKGQLIGEIFLTLITFPMVLKSLSIKFDSGTFVEMIKYGGPLVFSTTSSFILSFGDRYILQHYLTVSSVGVYSIGYKIASVINMLILQSFQLGFLPIAYKKLGDADEKRFFSKILTYYVIILTFTALSISLFSREIIEIFTASDDYWLAISVVPIVALAFVVKGIQYNFSLSFHYARKTVYNAVIVVITAIISLILNVIFIQKLGLIGAAYSMLVSITIMMLLSYYFGYKVYFIPFEKLKIFKVILVGVLLFYISSLSNSLVFPVRVFTKMIIIFLFPVVIYYANVFEEIEKSKTKEIVLAIFRRNK
jgi:O-antigen/teichoic acid export membrane protein